MERHDRYRMRIRSRTTAQWAAGLCLLVTLLLVTALLGPAHSDQSSDEPPVASGRGEPKAMEHMFRGWPKPDVALLLSGQQHGYLQPCGCSEPQTGGLARRYNFLHLLQNRDWPVVLADLGDIPQKSGAQTLVKYKYSMKSLLKLDYSAVGIGEHEVGAPLFDLLGEYALNEAKPAVLATNLLDKLANFPRDQAAKDSMVGDGKIMGGKNGTPSIGFFCVLGPTLAKKLDDKDKICFELQDKAIPRVLQGFQERKAELIVLLYQGDLKEAREVAKQFKGLHVILHSGDQEEPSSRPVMEGSTMLIHVGHKGRYVGVVGVNRTNNAGQPFELRYELAELGPDYETPKGKDQTNPIHALMEEYAKEIKDNDYLGKHPKGLHEMQIKYPGSEYKGSDACKKCHKTIYDEWKQHPHAHAYDTLKQAVRPKLRQFDPECVVCHVTGLDYKTGFINENATPHLNTVGCESCHGPASLHVKAKNDMQLRAALNPFKIRNGEDKKQHANRLNDSCVKCHDIDNSVNFQFEEFWFKKKTYHKTPSDEKEAPDDETEKKEK